MKTISLNGKGRYLKKVTTRIARPKEPGLWEDWQELIAYFHEGGGPFGYQHRVFDPDYPEGYCNGPEGFLEDFSPEQYARKWAHLQEKLLDREITVRVETVATFEKTTNELEDQDPPCRPDGGRDGSGMLM